MGPEGALVFVWAHGGQAPKEMALGLFSCLGTLCLASKVASVLALRTKTQLKSRSGTCLLRDAAGWRGSRAQRGWGAAWRGAHASCATAHWECSLWQPLGPCCRGGGELSLAQRFSGPLAFLTRAGQLLLPLSPQTSLYSFP